MGLSIKQVRDALAKTIRDHTESNVYVYPQIQGSGELPAVLIEPDSAKFDGAFNRGSDTWDFKLYILSANRVDEEDSQDELDGFVSGEGPDSIRQAIYDHSDLGLSGVTDARVFEMKDYGGKAVWFGVDHIGAILKVRVFLDNSAT